MKGTGTYCPNTIRRNFALGRKLKKKEEEEKTTEDTEEFTELHGGRKRKRGKAEGFFAYLLLPHLV